jgi:2-polyprenyl-3-methyl-5-hydroxy-6-metoxy-1,4-benzoquinol methylase
MKYGLSYTWIIRSTAFISKNTVRKEEFDYMINLAKNEEGKKVLDFGCDSGWLANKIKKAAPEKQVFGADINTAALKHAKKWYKKVEFYEINKEFFKKNKFDIVIVSHVLEHIKEREDFMKNLSKILSNNGKIIIAVPQERIRGDETIPIFLFNLIKLKFENPHIVKLNYDDVKNLLNKTGFKVDDKIYTNFFPPFKSKKRRLDSWSLIVSASKVKV